MSVTTPRQRERPGNVQQEHQDGEIPGGVVLDSKKQNFGHRVPSHAQIFFPFLKIFQQMGFLRKNKNSENPHGTAPEPVPRLALTGI